MFNFDDWFEMFWKYYPRDLCNGRPGKKPEAKICAKRWVKSQKEADRIMAATEAQLRYSRHELKKTGKTQYWPHVRTFFSSKGLWCDQEIPSYTQAETAQEAIVKTCIHCTNPVHGPSYDVCTDHITVVKIDHEPRIVGNAKEHLNTLKEMIKR